MFFSKFRQSAFVRSIKAQQREGLDRRQRLQQVVEQCQALTAADLPPTQLMNKIGSDDADHFVGVMTGLFREIVDRFQLQPDARVLDIGCGCGRMAIPFAFFLHGGRYVGVDVWRAGVDWCQQHIAAGQTGFAFECLDSANNYYFDSYQPDVDNDYRLPFVAERSIDLVFAVSVFTHLVENDVRSYLAEIERALDADGKVYLSAFVIDEYFFRFVEQTGMHTEVKEAGDGAYYAYSGQDFFAGYSFEKWRAMFAGHGLKIVSFEVGSWAQKPGARPYQDLFVLVRA